MYWFNETDYQNHASTIKQVVCPAFYVHMCSIKCDFSGTVEFGFNLWSKVIHMTSESKHEIR